MTIDIINYSTEQLAAMSEAQLMEVKEAQARKDRLKRKLDAQIESEKGKLVEKGIFNSELFTLIKNKLTAEYEEEVNLLRDGLLFYLLYTVRSGDQDAKPPYPINYSLTYAERYRVVRDYYVATYEDAHERVIQFRADEFAVKYLGEMYATLYDYLLDFM